MSEPKAYYSVYNQKYFTPANDDELNAAADRAWEKLSEHDQEVIQREIDHLLGLDASNSASQDRVYFRGMGPKSARELWARVGMWLAKNGAK